MKPEFKTLLYYIFLNFILLPSVLSLHEWGHWFVAYSLGYKDGVVEFTWAGGFFILKEPLKNVCDSFLIGIAGGFTVGILYTIFYYCLDWETDAIEKYVIRNYILHQFAYGYLEGCYSIGIFDYVILQLISNILYPILLYSTLIYIFIKYREDD